MRPDIGGPCSGSLYANVRLKVARPIYLYLGYLGMIRNIRTIAYYKYKCQCAYNLRTKMDAITVLVQFSILPFEIRGLVLSGMAIPIACTIFESEWGPDR